MPSPGPALGAVALVTVGAGRADHLVGVRAESLQTTLIGGAVAGRPAATKAAAVEDRRESGQLLAVDRR